MPILRIIRDGLKESKAVRWMIFAILWVVILSFIGTIFVSWGAGGISRFFGHYKNRDWAAVVGGETIGVMEYLRAFKSEDEKYRRMLGESYNPSMSRLISQNVLNQIVVNRIIMLEASRIGLTVSPFEIYEEVKNEPSFQEDGKFIGKERYQRILEANRLDVKAFEESIKRALLASKYRSLLGDSVIVIDREVEEEFQRTTDKISIEYVILDPEKLSEHVEVQEEELREYYDLNNDNYKTPVKKHIQYTFFPRKDILTELIVPREVEEYYREHLETSFTKKGDLRRASHILLKVDKDADQEADAKKREEALVIALKAREGEPFDQLARAFSEDGATRDKGGDLGYFAQGEVLPEIGNEAFTLESGAVSEPVRSPAGYHIIKVTDATNEFVTPLEEVYNDIADILYGKKARDILSEKAAKLREALSQGSDFEREAAAAGLTIEDADYLDPEEGIKELGRAPMIVATLRELPPNTFSDPVDIRGGKAIFLCLDQQEPTLIPIQEVKDRVKDDLISSRIETYSTQIAEEIRTKWSEGGSIEDLAAEKGLEVKDTGLFSRASNEIPGLGKEINMMENAFHLAAGEVGPVISSASGKIVFSIIEKKPGTREELEEKRDELTGRIRSEKQSRLFQLTMEKLKRYYGVRINENLLK